jgi:hypothetical protein
MKCIVLVLLAALCAQATAQACPTTVCNSYFANAMGGPIDCCKWDYNKGTCKWGELGRARGPRICSPQHHPPPEYRSCRITPSADRQAGSLRACVCVTQRVGATHAASPRQSG